MKTYKQSIAWVFSLLFSLVVFQSAVAQKYTTYYSDDDLWKLGFEAYKNNDFSEAALYLYAYGQRHRSILDNPDTKAKSDFVSVLNYVTKNLVVAAAVTKGDSPCSYYKLEKKYYDNKPAPNLSKVESNDAPADNPPPKPTSNVVTFGVGVNDYPDHNDAKKSKNIPNAFVNMYTVQPNAAGTAFEVVGVEIKSTGTGNNSGATFWVQPGQIVDFEGFKTWKAAMRGAMLKKNATWTAPPPYKNFAQGGNKLCQTNFMQVYKPLENGCATSLSTPYKR